jgi:hypothetical protein
MDVHRRVSMNGQVGDRNRRGAPALPPGGHTVQSVRRLALWRAEGSARPAAFESRAGTVFPTHHASLPHRPLDRPLGACGLVIVLSKTLHPPVIGVKWRVRGIGGCLAKWPDSHISGRFCPQGSAQPHWPAAAFGAGFSALSGDKWRPFRRLRRGTGARAGWRWPRPPSARAPAPPPPPRSPASRRRARAPAPAPGRRSPRPRPARAGGP